MTKIIKPAGVNAWRLRPSKLHGSTAEKELSKLGGKAMWGDKKPTGFLGKQKQSPPNKKK